MKRLFPHVSEILVLTDVFGCKHEKLVDLMELATMFDKLFYLIGINNLTTFILSNIVNNAIQR